MSIVVSVDLDRVRGIHLNVTRHMHHTSHMTNKKALDSIRL